MHAVRVPRRFPPLAAACLSFTLLVSPVVGQDDESEPEPVVPDPVAVLTVAGLDRGLTDVRYLFSTIGREDMSEVVDGLLGSVGDLEGLDRTRPMGVMLFLKPGFVPQPVPVGFVPVDDPDDLAKILNFGDRLVTKRTGAGRYELKGPRQTLHALIANDYALVTADETVLDDPLPDPLPIAAPLAARHDLSLALLVKNVPPGMRDLFLSFLRQNTQTQVQQRDDEPRAAYRVRKAQALRNLEALEATLTGMDRFVLGIDASEGRKNVELQMIVDVTAGSKFEELMKEGVGRATIFDPLMDETLPLSFVMSGLLNEWDQKALLEQLEVGREELAAFLSGLRGPTPDGVERVAATPTEEAARLDPASKALTDDLVEPIKSTIEAGELDGFVQFRREPPGGFVVLAGVKVKQGSRLAAAIPQVARKVRDRLPSNEADKFDEAVTLDLETVDGVTYHAFAVEPQREANAGEERFFGGKPAVFVGLGGDAVWAAAGTEDALLVLQDAVAYVRQFPTLGAKPQSPIRGAVNLTGWLGVGDGEGNAEEAAREAFEPGNDRITFNFLPTERGGALTVTLDEGFLRFLALQITNRYDRSRL